MVEGGYTEYGYRGLDELKKAQEKIAELEKELAELKQKLVKGNEYENR